MLLSATAARAGQPLQQRGGPAATSASRRSEGRRPHPGVPRPVRTQALFGFLAPAKPKSSPSKAQVGIDTDITLSMVGGIELPTCPPARRSW